MTNEIFLLTAKVIARLVNASNNNENGDSELRERLALMTQRPWWVIPLPDDDESDEDEKAAAPREKLVHYKININIFLFLCDAIGAYCRQSKEEFEAQLRELISESFALFKQAHERFNEAEWINLELFANITGLFELNNFSVSIETSIHRDLTDAAESLSLAERRAFLSATKAFLIEMKEREKEVHEHGECCEHSDEGEEEELDLSSDAVILEQLVQYFPRVEGTGNLILFRVLFIYYDFWFDLKALMRLLALGMIIGSLNHSCDPNAFVTFPEANFCAYLTALREIHEGEQIFIAYVDVDDPVEVRRRDLLEHGFVCRCQKCLSEE